MQIFAAFEVDAVFLTVSQLSARSGLPLATTHRLLAEMEQFGLLERQQDKTYRLGVRLWEIACRTPGALGLREIAKPYLQEVQARVRQHTQLGILEGHEVLFLERLSAREAVVNVTLVGGRLPLHASSSGLVLLAHSDASFQDEVLTNEMFRYTDRTVQTPEDLRSMLQKIRRDGFACGSGYIHPEARGIAVPVRGVNNMVVASLSVVVPNDDAPAAPFVPLLQAAALAISRDLHAAYAPTNDSTTIPGGHYRALVSSSVDSMQYLPTAPRPKFNISSNSEARDSSPGPP